MLTLQDTKDESDAGNKSDGQGQFDYKLLDDKRAIEASPTSPQLQQPTTPQRGSLTPRRTQESQNRHSWAPENVNVHVVLEHQYPQGLDSRRYSYSPLSNQDPTRYPSIRRKKSRTGLKEYSAKQALHESAQTELEERDQRLNGGDKLNGHI